GVVRATVDPCNVVQYDQLRPDHSHALHHARLCGGVHRSTTPAARRRHIDCADGISVCHTGDRAGDLLLRRVCAATAGVVWHGGHHHHRLHHALSSHYVRQCQVCV